MMRSYYLQTWYLRVASRVTERFKIRRSGIFAAGGAFVPTQEKKIKNSPLGGAPAPHTHTKILVTRHLTPRHSHRRGGQGAHTRKKKYQQHGSLTDGGLSAHTRKKKTTYNLMKPTVRYPTRKPQPAPTTLRPIAPGHTLRPQVTPDPLKLNLFGNFVNSNAIHTALTLS